jgi:uncharacterized cupin superfamily protein
MLGRQAGARDLGASLFELPPGAATFPLHAHYSNEEMIMVLAGRPTLTRADGGTRVSSPARSSPAQRDARAPTGSTTTATRPPGF